MTRKITLSLLTLFVVACLVLSLVAIAAAVLFIRL
jgi:hypothetical protein